MPIIFRILTTGFQRRGRPPPPENQLNAAKFASNSSTSIANGVFIAAGRVVKMPIFLRKFSIPILGWVFIIGRDGPVRGQLAPRPAAGSKVRRQRCFSPIERTLRLATDPHPTTHRQRRIIICFALVFAQIDKPRSSDILALRLRRRLLHSFFTLFPEAEDSEVRCADGRWRKRLAGRSEVCPPLQMKGKMTDEARTRHELPTNYQLTAKTVLHWRT
jgi:hypothetical protein